MKKKLSAMKLIRNLPFFLNQKTIITIGNFDAMHRGHQFLLDKLVAKAKSLNLASVLITFEPLPAEFFSHQPPARLSSFREKWLLLKKWPIDFVVILRFNKKLETLSAQDFIKTILVECLKIHHVMVGQDFRFGFRREGNVTSLMDAGKTHHFTVEPIPPRLHEGTKISSTLVRRCLAKGKCDEARLLLNRPYTLSGHVVPGLQLGQKLGFPTANISLRRKKIPLQGVYVVKVYGLGPTPLPGVANVGTRPTLRGTHALLEVHLLNFDSHAPLYKRLLTVEFVTKLRDEKRFKSLEDLRQQIAQDVVATQIYFCL